MVSAGHIPYAVNESGINLVSIAIRRFRCIYDLPYVSIKEGLTVVAGQNDGGKSSFLDAIAFLLGEKALDKKDLCNQASEDECIEVEGVFSAGGETKAIRIRATWDLESKRKIQMQQKIHKELGAAPESMNVPELREACVRLIPGKTSGTTKQAYIDALKSWQDTQPEENLVEIWGPVPPDVADRLPKLQVFSTETATNPINAIQQVIRSRSQQLLQSPHYRDRLNEIESEIVKELRASVEFIEDRIRVHCDDLDGINIHSRFDYSKLQPSSTVEFVRNELPVDYTKVGEGRQRKATIAVHEANLDALKADEQTTSYLLVYDEPDSHLDYVSQRRIARILEDQSSLSHVQVIVATHSKNIIDHVPLDSVLSFSLNDDLQTDARGLGSPDYDNELEFQAEMYASLGLTNSVILDDKVFLLVEGATELHALPIIFRIVAGKSMVASGVHLVDIGGSKSTTVFIDRLKGHWRKKVVALVDEDARSNLTSSFVRLGFEEGRDLFFCGTKEFEDAFSDETWLETLQRDFPVSESENGWDIGVFEGIRNSPKFSRALLDVVRRRTLKSDVSKIELARSVAKTCEEDDAVPEDLRKCIMRIVEMTRA